MKIKLIVIFLGFSFLLIGQEKINVDLSTGVTGTRFSGVGGMFIKYQSDFDNNLIHGIGVSVFLKDIFYLRTEFATLKSNKVFELEIPTGFSGDFRNEYDRLKYSEHFISLGIGVKQPIYGFYCEVGLAAAIVSKQEFTASDDILPSNYLAGIITIGWKRAYLGINDNFGVMINAKYISTFSALFDAPMSYLNQDILSLNLGLHYALRGKQ